MMLQELRQQGGPQQRAQQEQPQREQRQQEREQDSASAHGSAPRLHPGAADLVAAACDGDDTEQRYDQGGRLVQLGGSSSSSSGLPRRLQHRVRMPIKAAR